MPAASVVRLAKALVAPTVLPNVVVPAALTASAKPPSTAPLKITSPEPAEATVSAVSWAVPKEAVAFVVAMVPASFVSDGDVDVRPPAKVSESVPALPSVTVPVFANVTAFVIETGDPVRITS